MDLAFTPEEQTFRRDIRGWVAANLPGDISHKVHNALHDSGVFVFSVEHPLFTGGESAKAMAVDFVEDAIDFGAEIVAVDLDHRADGHGLGGLGAAFHPAWQLDVGPARGEAPVGVLHGIHLARSALRDATCHPRGAL